VIVLCADLDERNMYRIEIKLHEKELCVKLVIYKDFTEMHGQQNIKVIQQNQEPGQQSTTRRNTKTVKNAPYHLHTASSIYKKKIGMYKQK
jgi:hypothetical protein